MGEKLEFNIPPPCFLSIIYYVLCWSALKNYIYIMQYTNLRFQKLSAAEASQNTFRAERQKDIHLKKHAVL